MFAAETQSFLCGKFSTVQLEVLPKLKHEGEHLLFDSARSWGIYKFQIAGK